MKHLVLSLRGVRNAEYYCRTQTAERRDWIVDHWDTDRIEDLVAVVDQGVTRDGVPWYGFFLTNGEYGIYYDRQHRQ